MLHRSLFLSPNCSELDKTGIIHSTLVVDCREMIEIVANCSYLTSTSLMLFEKTSFN